MNRYLHYQIVIKLKSNLSNNFSVTGPIPPYRLILALLPNPAIDAAQILR
jgi:hypothetical protein